jgi:hypothetical protein
MATAHKTYVTWTSGHGQQPTVYRAVCRDQDCPFRRDGFASYSSARRSGAAHTRAKRRRLAQRKDTP